MSHLIDERSVATQERAGKDREGRIKSKFVARTHRFSYRGTGAAASQAAGMGGGYGNDKAPWRFTGRALYQLNLVRSSEARKHVPKDLKLVELFGWTLGGVYLARYDDSPAGTFDEMVALGGLVWNPPTSCAWAARVLVNSKEARQHGVKTCGLPSHFVDFNDELDRAPERHGWWKDTRPESGLARAERFVKGGWKNALRKNDEAPKETKGGERVVVRDGKGAELCSLALPHAAPSLPGPRIKMFLPSFSGRTDTCPDLLKYSLELNANVRLSAPVMFNDDAEADPAEGGCGKKKKKKKSAGDGLPGFIERALEANRGVRRFPPQLAVASLTASDPTPAPAAVVSDESPAAERDAALAGILHGKPLLCIAFDCMRMDVGVPKVVPVGK